MLLDASGFNLSADVQVTRDKANGGTVNVGIHPSNVVCSFFCFV